MTDPSSNPFHAIYSSCWEVLTFFLIPIGGGIPAGVLLAKNRGLTWPIMVILYFISDLILAILFEPIMRVVMAISRHSIALSRFVEATRKSMKLAAAHYGGTLGPFALIMVSFGVDPMTGRAAAVASGHGFLSGWALAIAGDMLFFALLMVSTLWLTNVLGDGTWATIIILLIMVAVPPVIRKIRDASRARH